MKIAIDLDGTAWFHTEFFVEFVTAMKERGHLVGILTSHGKHLKETDLEKWDQLGFPEPDFYIYKTQKDKDKYKPMLGNNGLWKAEKVREHHIDYLFGDLDDDEMYVEYFRKQHPYRLFRVWGEI